MANSQSNDPVAAKTSLFCRRRGLAIAAVWLGCGLSLAHADCGVLSGRTVETVALSSLGVDARIYFFDQKRGLLKRDLTSNAVTQAAAPTLEGGTSAIQSANGRWIGYTSPASDDATTYWVFDKKEGSVHAVISAPKWSRSIPGFSPDSQWLAFTISTDRPASPRGAAALYLFEMETRRLETFEMKDVVGESSGKLYTSPDWNADGSGVQVLVRDMESTDERSPFVYLDFSLSDRKFERVDGYFEGQEHVFQRHGDDVPAYQSVPLPSDASYGTLESPDGRWVAAIDADHILTVSAGAGVRTDVDKGRYDSCEGVTIRIHGWIDNDHLIYTADGTTYVYAASTQRLAYLFPEAIDKKSWHRFFW